MKKGFKYMLHDWSEDVGVNFNKFRCSPVVKINQHFKGY